MGTCRGDGRIRVKVSSWLVSASAKRAMPREQPAGRTLRSTGRPDAVLADIMWHNCFRFLGIEPSKLFS